MPGIADQYRIIAGAAGWRRASEWGCLQFLGRDRLSFLHALVTNDVGSLAAGQGAYAAWLTPQGRMISDLRLLARADRVLAAVPASGAAALAGAFDRLIFAEDVSVSDISSQLATLAVVGGEAPAILARASGVDADRLGAMTLWSGIEVEDGVIVRTDDAHLPAYVLCLSTEREGDAVAKLTSAGARPLSDELAEALRIDAARPRFGIDMNTDTIPLEAGLEARAISTTKGCYVGQEVIIRVLHRGGGRVARRLVQIAFDTATPDRIRPGQLLRVEGADAGRVTSSAPALDGTGAMALGYVRREIAEAGGDVQIQDQLSPAESIAGRILGLAG